MSIPYALDFGRTNTVIASDHDGAVNVVPLRPDLSGTAERVRTSVVPSAVTKGKPPSAFRPRGAAPAVCVCLTA